MRQPQREKSARFRAKHPERAAQLDRAARSRWSAANLEKRRAHSKVLYAIQKGRMTRPTACEKCGKECKPEAAHHDYSQPYDVRWLCRLCHIAYDRNR